MKKMIVSLALLVLVGSGGAYAQSGGGLGSSNGQSLKGGIPEAPVGHRQPRASDVPDEKNLGNPNDMLGKENSLLDKKIKSICRGC